MKRSLLKWFGLKAIPFGKDLGSKQLFSYLQLDELNQILELAIESSSSVLISAQAGTGKTTAVRCFLESLPSNRYRIVYLGNDQLGTNLFIRLGLELGLKPSRSYRMIQLAQHIRRHVIGSGKQLLLVIDEAHLLDYRTLEDIRLLTNSDMDSKSDIILFMLGHLWLRTKLKGHGHEALYQRMRFRYGLEGLSKQQTHEYIQHHLALVGCTKEILTSEALEHLFMASGGILREINNLMVDSMLKAMNLGLHKIDLKVIRMVVNQRDSS